MLQAANCRANDGIARAQLALFHDLSDGIKLLPEERRRALDLSDRDWHAWDYFMADGPLPSWPPLPEMLRRLGQAAFTLSAATNSERCHQAPRRQAPCDQAPCDQAGEAQPLARECGVAIENRHRRFS